MKYKVVDLENTLVGGRVESAKLEAALNKYVTEDWCYSAVITTVEGQLLLLLEREGQSDRVG